jgi:hypothetical protein
VIGRPALTRDRAVNYGDRTTLRPGAPPQQLAWVTVECSQSWIVYAQAQVTQPLSGEFPLVVPFVDLEWGHGGASVRARFPLIPGTPAQPGNILRVPLAASTIKASGVLLNQGGDPLDPANPAAAQVSCFAAPGFDGITQLPTEWIPLSGSSGSMTPRPSKITRVLGYLLTGTAPLWVMLLDTIEEPGFGSAPVVAAPVGPFPSSFDLALPNGVPFSRGVWLSVSSAPERLNPTPSATVFARVERQLL